MLNLRRSLLALFVLAFVSVSANAQRPDPAESRSVTLYPRGIAEIVETRIVPLADGVQTIALPMISPEIELGSVELTVLSPRGVESNGLAFSDHLLDLDDYWAGRIGETVEISLDDSSDVYGVLRRANDKQLFIDQAGTLLPVDRSEADASLTLRQLPAGMVTEPSLLWQLHSRSETSARIELRYLSSGFELSGSHRLLVEKDRAALQGALLVNNSSGLTLPYDQLTLATGALHLAGDKRRVDRLNPRPGALSAGEKSRFGELHRWSIQREGSFADNTASRVEILEASAVVERYYEYDATIFDDRVRARLGFTLALPLPAGEVLVSEKKGEERLFTGSDRIDDTPAGSPLELTLAQVFDITAERTRLAEGETQQASTVQRYQVVLGNSRDEDVSVRVLERLFGDWSVHEATLDGEPIEVQRRDARTARFDVPVKAGETATLTYEIRYAR